jgi:hypothetical protein
VVSHLVPLWAFVFSCTSNVSKFVWSHICPRTEAKQLRSGWNKLNMFGAKQRNYTDSAYLIVGKKVKLSLSFFNIASMMINFLFDQPPSSHNKHCFWEIMFWVRPSNLKVPECEAPCASEVTGVQTIWKRQFWHCWIGTYWSCNAVNSKTGSFALNRGRLRNSAICYRLSYLRHICHMFDHLGMSEPSASWCIRIALKTRLDVLSRPCDQGKTS